MSRDVLLKIISQFESKGVDEAKRGISELAKLDKTSFLGGLGNIFKGMASNVLGLLNPLNAVHGLLGTVGNAVQHLGGVFKIGLGVAAGAAIQTVTSAFAQLVSSPVEVAARVETLTIVFNRLGQQAGYTAEQLGGFVEGLKKTGITTQESLGNLTSMIQANLDLSKATDLARVAQNAAVIAGTNSSEAFATLLHGITTLQPEVLRGLGIIVDMQGEVKKWADAHGVAATAVDASTKQQIAFDAVLAAGQNIAGAYESAMETVGKKMGSLKRYVEEAQLALGQGFLPILSSAMDILTDVFKKAQSLFQSIQPALTAFSEKVGAGLTTLYEKVQGAIGFLVEAFSRAQPYLQQLGDIMGQYLPQVAERLRLLWLALKDAISGLATTISAYLPSMAGAWTTFTDIVKGALDSVLKILDGFRLLLKGQGEQAAINFSDAIANGLAILIIIWEDYASKALAWGYNLISSFASGIIDGASSFITEAANYVGSLISSFFASFSPPKRGALQGILDWGKGLINTYFHGFTQADFGILDQVGGMIQNALQSAVSLGNLPEEEMLPLFGKVREQVAGLIADFRKTGEISEEALSKIGETLGVGSEDLVQMLRLQLEYQKTLKNLASVQEEYDAAEAAGFVPAELKAKLKSAQEAADAKAEELSWQEALIKAQQDSVDIQVQQVQVLQRLAKALEGMAGAMGGATGGVKAPKAAKVPKAEEIGAITGPKVGSITMPKVDTSKMKADVEAGIGKAFSGVSERFAEAKEKGKKLLANLVEGAKESLANLPATIRDGIGQAIVNLRENYPWIDELIAKFESLAAWWNANWPIMLATFLTVWTVIRESIGVVADFIIGYVWPKLQEAFSSLSEVAKILGIDWSDVWSAIGKAIGITAVIIGAIILGLVAAITGIATAIASVAAHVSAVFADIAATFMKGLESISKLVGGAMAIVRGIFTGDLDLILQGWRAWKDGLWGLVTAVFEGMINFFNLSFGTLIAAVRGFVEGFIGFFVALYDRLVGGSIIPELIEGALALFQQLYDETIGKIVGLVTDVIAKFSEMKDQVLERVAAFVTDVLAKFGEFRDQADVILTQIRDWVVEKITAIADSFNSIRDAVGGALEKLTEFLASLAGAILPDWLLPGSPTPFELGIRGIFGALGELATAAQGLFVFQKMREDLTALVGAGGLIPLFVTQGIRWFVEFRTGVEREVQAMANRVVQLANQLVTTALQLLRQLITTALQLLRQFADQVLTLFTQLKDQVIALIQETVQGVLDALIALRDESAPILEEIAQIFEEIGERIKEPIEAIRGEIGKLNEALDDLIDKAKEAEGALKDAGLMAESPSRLQLGFEGATAALLDLHHQMGNMARDMAAPRLNQLAPVAASGGTAIYLQVDRFEFPSVRTARDAGDFLTELNAMVDRATSRAQTPGGAK